MSSGNDRILEDYETLLDILPTDIQRKLRPVIHEAEEVKMRFGLALKIKHHGKWHKYPDLVVTQDHLTDFRSSFDAIRDDNRAGIDGTGHRISRVPSADGKGTDGFNVRIARFFEGVAEVLREFLFLNPSMLICGMAGRGKSTTLRGVASIIAEKYDANVTIVDTSNEVGGDGRIPHPGIGEADRYFVPVKAKQHEVMLEAIANNSAHILIIDEVQTKLEADTIRHLSAKARFVATTHGDDLVEIITNALLHALFYPAPLFKWALMIPELGRYEVYDMEEAVKAVDEGRQPVPKACFQVKVGQDQPAAAQRSTDEGANYAH